MKTIILQITGINCASCGILIERKLNIDNRIKSVNVNIATGKTKIEFDPQKISEQNITNIIERAGFGVQNQKSTTKLDKTKKLQKTLK